jgi:hypothetical protein
MKLGQQPYSFLCGGIFFDLPMHDQRLDDLMADRIHGIQGQCWILHEQGNFLSSQPDHFFLIQSQKIPVFVHNFSMDSRIFRQKPENGVGDSRFSASCFPDEGQRFFPVEVEGCPVHGMDMA